MNQLAISGGEPVRNTPLFYGHQYIDEDDIAAVVNVLRSDFLTCGPKIQELEQRLCSITGARYAAVLSNGTAALHAACMAAGIGPGDEVITTPITFAASANCVLYCGAKPVFADIRPNTYNLSPDAVRRCIHENTRAVIAVDFTGQAVEIDALKEICETHHLTLIEDAAHSLGTKYSGKPIGSLADLTTFSFHPVKTVTAGEGGAVMTNDEQFFQKLQLFRAHGITRNKEFFTENEQGPWYYEQVALGFNYRMTDIQAALLISQLNKLERFSERRKEIVKKYDAAFSQIPEALIQEEIPQSDTTRHLYILRLNLKQLNATRREIFNALAAENIHCNVHYIPVYYFPYYARMGYRRGLCPHAEALYDSMLTLPLYYSMSDDDVNDVIEAVRKVLSYYSKKRF